MLTALAAAVASVAAAGCDQAHRRAGDSAACVSLAVPRPQPPPPVDAGRPVMGWNPYNTFGTRASQSLVVAVVKAMAADGMRAAGYRYILLDDGWQGPRASDGQLTADPARFPCGIARLAAFAHAEGFRFGIYTSAAAKACSGRAGSGGHVARDARTFAAWGVDYVKVDWCGADYSPAGAAALTRSWRAALTAARRPLILSINAGGSPSVGSWASGIAGSWRVGGDICGSWYNQTRPPAATARACSSREWDQGLYDYLTSPGLRQQARLAGPGHHIDPDMLEVGAAATAASGDDLLTTALSPAEAATNFAMWAMWSAPLIAGDDPRAVPPASPASVILRNPGLIAVDQDRLGRPAALVLDGPPPGRPARPGLSAGTWQVWRKPLAGGQTAVAIVNLTDTPEAATFPWAALGAGGRPGRLTDLWTGRPAVVPASGLTLRLPAHATAVYQLAPG